MMAAIRNFAKSWPARILMAVLAISFIGWGINRTGTSVVGGDDVIKAGSRKIDSYAFKREYDNFKKAQEQRIGQPITPEMAAENHLDTIVLNGVATREAFSEMLARMGIRPSDKLILAQIEKIPAFFDPISGRFDKKTFQQRLAENGMTPQALDADIRDSIAVQHWEAAMQNGLRAPRAYGALAAIYALETRDLTYMTLGIDSVPKPAQPTDAQLTGFINENKSQLTLPEMRQLTVVLFTPAQVQAQVANAPIDPKELQKRYDFRKDTLSQPETRTLVQIPVKDQAAANTVVARLNKGEDPSAIAKSLGVDAVDFTDKPQTAISDRKVGAAAFKMTPGQVSAVQGDLGLSVVKLVSVTPGHTITLEEARPMLEAEIRKDMVAEKVYAQTQAFDDAHQGGANLADSAAKAGVTAQQLGPISKDGFNDKGGQIQGLPPKILETAFNLPAGGESEITDLGEGAYFAVRVDKITPPHVPPLDQIRDVVARAYLQREIVKALEAKGAALQARIEKGESFDAVAASAGLQVAKVTGLSRQTAQTHQEVPQEVLARAFAAKPNEVWTGRAPNGLVLGRVANVRMDSGPAAARLAEQGRPQLSQAIYREMAEAAQTYARSKLKVKVDAERAHTAAGFEPEEKGKAKPKTPEKKG
jgi:peptidyl-prolyl cis-trans isomerase D